jgi:uncharacterized protein with HEPN domain
MQNDLRAWLYDILNAIMEIDTFLLEINHDYDKYLRDSKTKRATERNIEIIGEAVNRILKVDHEIEISYSRNIVDARNRIIHGYDSVSDILIWSIISQYLPILRIEVEKLLGET